MAFTKKAGRKAVFIAENTVTFADIVSATALPLIDMPAGTVIDDVFLALDTTFNPTTSAVVEIGITGTTAKFVASQNLFTGQTVGGRAGAVTGKGTRITAPTTINALYTSGGGAATQGQFRVVVVFHYENEADFTVGGL